MWDKKKILLLAKNINLVVQIIIMIISAAIIIYYRYMHPDYTSAQVLTAIAKDPDLTPFWVTIELIILSGIIGEVLNYILKKKYNIEEQ